MGRTFAEQLPDGRRGDLAVSALEEITFVTDGKGSQLPAPVSMLIAGNRDLRGASRVFSQDDATGAWTAVILAQDRPTPNFLRRCAAWVGTATARRGSTGSLPGRIRVASSAAFTIR